MSVIRKSRIGARAAVLQSREILYAGGSDFLFARGSISDSVGRSSPVLTRGRSVRAARAAIILCISLSTLVGTWYLRVRMPENQWLGFCGAGRESLERGRFQEAERHFLAAVEAARVFGEADPRVARSLFLLAQALVGQARQTEALSLLERSIAIYDKSLGPDHPESARVETYY